MEHRDFLIFSLCFLFLLSNISHSVARFSGGKESVMKLTTGTSSVPLDPTRVTQISWRPRAFIYRAFLTDKECDHLITLAKDKLEKSMVADNESGKSIESEVRTSSGMFLKKAQ
ncbi:probable prolyl 4-hydroxylase 7, partial [Olea europaea subsp. europaea]